MNKTTVSLALSCLLVAPTQASITQTIANFCYASYLRLLSNEMLVSKAHDFYSEGYTTAQSAQDYYKDELDAIQEGSKLNTAITQHVSAFIIRSENYSFIAYTKKPQSESYPFISYANKLVVTNEKLQSQSNTISLITDELEKRTELMMQADIQTLYKELEDLFFDLSDLSDNLTILHSHVIHLDAFKKEWDKKQFAILSHQDKDEKNAHHQHVFDERHQNHTNTLATQADEKPQQLDSTPSATFHCDYELGFTDFVQ